MSEYWLWLSKILFIFIQGEKDTANKKSELEQFKKFKRFYHYEPKRNELSYETYNFALSNLYEKVNRNFYGGAIGFIDFSWNFNHAIIIRSFFSKNNILNYQAGAGIVIDSDPEKELEEVQNKLGALDRALIEAELIKWKKYFW